MSKEYSDAWYKKVMTTGDRACEFAPHVRVWSEMAVRIAIVNAIKEHEANKKEVEQIEQESEL